MNKKVHFFWFFALLLSASCSLNQKMEQPVAQVNVTVVEPDRIRFSGKGAGAGMMLMSSMGPMGMAIGVAIDEGIGKEIDTNTRSEAFDIRLIVGAALQAYWQENTIVQSAYPETIEVSIERFGFITQPGDSDPVAPQLHVTHGAKTVKFPEDFAGSLVPSAPLDQVKTEPELVRDLYRQAADIVSEALMQKEG